MGGERGDQTVNFNRAIMPSVLFNLLDHSASEWVRCCMEMAMKFDTAETCAHGKARPCYRVYESLSVKAHRFAAMVREVTICVSLPNRVYICGEQYILGVRDVFSVATLAGDQGASDRRMQSGSDGTFPCAGYN
jgi:hypothetical protein